MKYQIGLILCPIFYRLKKMHRKILRCDPDNRFSFLAVLHCRLWENVKWSLYSAAYCILTPIFNSTDVVVAPLFCDLNGRQRLRPSRQQLDNEIKQAVAFRCIVIGQPIGRLQNKLGRRIIEWNRSPQPAGLLRSHETMRLPFLL